MKRSCHQTVADSGNGDFAKIAAGNGKGHDESLAGRLRCKARTRLCGLKSRRPRSWPDHSCGHFAFDIRSQTEPFTGGQCPARTDDRCAGGPRPEGRL